MTRKIATIDEFSPLWSDFEAIYNNLPDEDKKQWLVDNCSIEPYEIDEETYFDDIAIDAGDWFIAWGDIGYVWVNLFERV